MYVHAYHMATGSNINSNQPLTVLALWGHRRRCIWIGQSFFQPFIVRHNVLKSRLALPPHAERLRAILRCWASIRQVHTSCPSPGQQRLQTRVGSDTDGNRGWSFCCLQWCTRDSRLGKREERNSHCLTALLL